MCVCVTSVVDVHSGPAICLLNPAARDDDAEPSRVATEADDQGVCAGDVSTRRAAEGDRARVPSTHDAARRVAQPHRAERRTQGPRDAENCPRG